MTSTTNPYYLSPELWEKLCEVVSLTKGDLTSEETRSLGDAAVLAKVHSIAGMEHLLNYIYQKLPEDLRDGSHFRKPSRSGPISLGTGSSETQGEGGPVRRRKKSRKAGIFKAWGF